MRKFFLLVIFLITGVLHTNAQEENFIALSVYNFTRYVNWPSDEASGEFYIDVIGHKSVFDKLKEVAAGRKVGNKTIAVRFLETTANITSSDILFVGFWQSKDMSKVLDKVGNHATLIISEKDGLIETGSAINFVVRNGALKFEIKKANIQKYGLTVNETLLSLAYKTY